MTAGTIYICAKCSAKVITPGWISGLPVCYPCTKNEAPDPIRTALEKVAQLAKIAIPVSARHPKNAGSATAQLVRALDELAIAKGEAK